jgi:hypothetical protein
VLGFRQGAPVVKWPQSPVKRLGRDRFAWTSVYYHVEVYTSVRLVQISLAVFPATGVDSGAITTGEKMIRTILLSACLVICSLALSARAQDAPGQVAPAQDVRQYTDGPVTEEDYIDVEYGHFAEYVDWLNTTWKPTMEASKKAGLIIDFKVFQATPKSPDQPNIILWITFKNGQAALDNGPELEDVAKRVIGSTEFQNKARQFRNQYRKVLGSELIREIILK